MILKTEANTLRCLCAGDTSLSCFSVARSDCCPLSLKHPGPSGAKVPGQAGSSPLGASRSKAPSRTHLTAHTPGGQLLSRTRLSALPSSKEPVSDQQSLTMLRRVQIKHETPLGIRGAFTFLVELDCCSLPTYSHASPPPRIVRLGPAFQDFAASD